MAGRGDSAVQTDDALCQPPAEEETVLPEATAVAIVKKQKKTHNSLTHFDTIQTP